MVGGISKITRDVPPYFLVEGNPAQAYGLNSIGLRRAEFTAETIAELKECYKLMYHSNRNISQALEAMQRDGQDRRRAASVDFIEAESERGILK